MFNINDLIKSVSEITESGLPFMEGKEKLAVEGDILNQVLSVDDYGFLSGEEGEYVVIALKEYPNNFIYGSSVVTQAFKKMDTKLSKDEIAYLIEEGLTFKLTKTTSANKRKYTKITFFPKN